MSEQLEEPFADVVEFLFFVVAVAEKAAGDVLNDRFEELLGPFEAFGLTALHPEHEPEEQHAQADEERHEIKHFPLDRAHVRRQRAFGDDGKDVPFRGSDFQLAVRHVVRRAAVGEQPPSVERVRYLLPGGYRGVRGDQFRDIVVAAELDRAASPEQDVPLVVGDEHLPLAVEQAVIDGHDEGIGLHRGEKGAEDVAFMDDGGDIDIDVAVVGLVHEQDGDGGVARERPLEIEAVPGVEGRAVRGVGYAVEGDEPHAFEAEGAGDARDQRDDRLRIALPQLPENMGKRLDGLDVAAHVRFDGVGVLARHFSELRFGLFLNVLLRPAEIEEEYHGEQGGRHDAVQSIGTQSPQFSLVHNVSSDEVCSPAMNNNAC